MASKRIPVWGDLLVVTGIFLAATLVGALFMYLLGLLFPEFTGPRLVLVVYSVQFVLAIAGAAVYYGVRNGRVFSLSFRWYNAPLTLCGIVLITAASVVLEPVMNLFPERYFDQIGTAIGSGVWAIALSVVAAPIFEEIFFRGLVLEQTARRWGAGRAVVVSALLFGLVHLPNLPQTLNAAVMGLVMGYIYVATRSLSSVIVIHAVNNAIAYLFLKTMGTQNTDLRSVMDNEAAYWSVFGASALLLAVAAFLIIRSWKVRGIAMRTDSGETDKKQTNEKNR